MMANHLDTYLTHTRFVWFLVHTLHYLLEINWCLFPFPSFNHFLQNKSLPTPKFPSERKVMPLPRSSTFPKQLSGVQSSLDATGNRDSLEKSFCVLMFLKVPSYSCFSKCAGLRTSWVRTHHHAGRWATIFQANPWETGDSWGNLGMSYAWYIFDVYVDTSSRVAIQTDWSHRDREKSGCRSVIIRLDWRIITRRKYCTSCYKVSYVIRRMIYICSGLAGTCMYVHAYPVHTFINHPDSFWTLLGPLWFLDSCLSHLDPFQVFIPPCLPSTNVWFDLARSNT